MRPLTTFPQMIEETDLIKSTFASFSKEIRRLLSVYNTDNLTVEQINRAIDTAIKEQGKLEKSRVWVLESFFDVYMGGGTVAGTQLTRAFLDRFGIEDGPVITN